MLSIFGLARSAKEKAIAAPQIGAIIGSYITQALAASDAEIPYSQLIDAYKSWVYTCIDKIAKSVAMIPLKLYIYRRKGQKVSDLSWRAHYRAADQAERRYILKQMQLEREQILDHPFLDLIQKPNGIMTRFSLWYETMVRLEVGGKCGWYLPKNKLGLPQEIIPLPLTKYASLKPKVSSDLEIEYWSYRDGNIDRRFLPDEVLFIHYPHPASPFYGMSPLIAQAYPYDIDLFLMQQQRALLANQAVPGLTMTTDQKLTKAQAEELMGWIKEQYGGPLKAGDTMIFHSGLKPEKAAFTAREMMIDEVARYAREKLISAFDLSEGKLGLVRDVNRANMEALNETFVNECLRPKCMLIEEVIETFLLPRYDEGLTCDFILPDLSEREILLKERELNLKNYYTTINEEREKEGRPPVPWGDKPWAPFNLMQLDAGKGAAAMPPGERTEEDAFWGSGGGDEG